MLLQLVGRMPRQVLADPDHIYIQIASSLPSGYRPPMLLRHYRGFPVAR